MKRSPLRRFKGLVRKTSLKPRSERMQIRYVERRALVKRLLQERPRCEFPGCRERSAHLHERLTRGRGGSILEEENIVLVCFAHHRWIHDNPAHATDLGLLAHSWDVTQETS